MKAKGWLVSISAALIRQLGRFCRCRPCKPKGPPSIAGYSQNSKSLTVELTCASEPAKFLMLPSVPETLNVKLLAQQAEHLEFNNRRITVHTKNEPIHGEYAILIFVGSEYFELVRQSQFWLKNTFNFDRPGGYTILGRRTLSTKDSARPTLPPLVFHKKPENLRFKPVHVASWDEVDYATGLLNVLWSEPIQQGPTSQSYSQFLEQTFEEKMRRVKTGEFAVMCQGFRDLFLHASSATDAFRARPVEAYNYSPQIPDLITYGHSTAEIYVRSLNKWVLLDPWLGIIVTRNSVPLGARDLSKYKRSSDLAVMPLMDRLPRMYRNGDGQLVHNTFEPRNVQLEGFSCQGLGCSPGYLDYFNAIVKRRYQIK